jgi:U3 small nucleolar RNA-associated protein 18
MAKQRSKITKQHTGSIVSPLTSSIPDDADAEMRVPREQHQQHDGNDSDSDSDDNDIIAASTTTPTTNTYSEQRKNESRKSNKEGSSKSSKVRTMSQSKLMEEAALTALLFGGGGDGNDTMGGRSAFTAMAEFGTNDTIGTATSWAELDRDRMTHSNASYAKDEDLFAIDRSGEEDRADNDNENDNADEDFMDEEDDDKMDRNREDYEDEDEKSMSQGKLDSKSNKAMMTGAAWDDSDSEEESHNSDDDDNEEDQFSIESDDISDEKDEEEEYDAHAKRRSKKQRKGVSLVDGPNRLKKLRRYADETNPLSFKEYELRLRERFITTASVAARTDWADVGLAKQLQDQHQQQDADTISGKRQKKKRGGYTSSDSDDNDDDGDDAAERILESNASLFDTSTNGGRRTLPPTILDILRCRDGNLQDPNNSVVSATQFHPNSDEDNPLLMTAGLDKMLRFFRIGDADDDSETNSTKIHGIHLPELPITCASFLGSGTLASSVILSGRRPFFYVYDAVSGNIQKIAGISGRAERSLERFRVSPDGRVIAFVGNDGYVILVDGKTRQWIGELKMNGSVRALTFTEDSEYILGSGSDGDVYR